MSIIVSDISYRYPDQRILLEHISFSVPPNGKISIVGNNGTGKSTLLKLLAGELTPLSGSVQTSSPPYYIPQLASAAQGTVAEALGVSQKIGALHRICAGRGEQIDYDLLADDWDIESQCRSALEHWGLPDAGLSSPIDSLSGGEKTRIFLAGLSIHKPGIVLLDEPTNHLDRAGREKLYEYVACAKAAIVFVSHDIALLELSDTTCELSDKGIKVYGGNYSFYKELKENEDRALARRIDSGEAALRSARKKAREVRERQDKRAAHGERGKQKGGVARIVMNARGGSAENSSAKLKEKHSGIIAGKELTLSELRRQQHSNRGLKIDFDDARLHSGKLLVEAVNINFGYPGGNPVWDAPLNVEVRSGERIHITGDNGTGKTTLIRLLTGELQPSEGTVRRSDFSYVYLDQLYGRVDRDATVFELACEYNTEGLREHEIKLRLDRALFPKEAWDKNCRTLSGGERMRLYLCCLMISNHVPDMFILDEPTNNLDLASLSILTGTVANYRGTVLVISHDRHFVKETGITKSLELKTKNR